MKGGHIADIAQQRTTDLVWETNLGSRLKAFGHERKELAPSGVALVFKSLGHKENRIENA
jgi:hypothetical protein